MQRKTNLFYVNGNDANFLTFSNYTESLTGNFLATDWKLYPSKFICLNIPSLTVENKSAFIKHLVATYENKLAFMRDYYLSLNMQVEDNILPFEWLIESVMAFDGETQITHISEITEQNYNGVYADTICTIDTNDASKVYTLVENDEFSLDDPIVYADGDNSFSSTYLYGWYNVNNDSLEEYCGLDSFANVMPKLDADVISAIQSNTNVPVADRIQTIINGIDKYYINVPYYKSIRIGERNGNSIDFNVIIPLFDITNINPDTNVNIINENIDLTTQIASETESKINVPMGIWFANETVSLHRDETTGYSPAWSLVLSSQFKPFPYSNKLTDDITDSNTSAAYATFAQVLVRQNELMEQFDKINVQLNSLANRIDAMESKLSNIATSNSIDDLHIEMINFEQYIKNIHEANNIETTTSYMVWTSNYTE